MNMEALLRGVVFLGVFALPLVVLLVVDNLFFPYIVGKNIAFRILVEIIVAAWVLLALLNAQYRPRWTALLLSVTAFVGILALAATLGENPYKSFWSNFERMDGFVTILHLFAYTIVAGTVLATDTAWLWLWRTSLVVASFVSLHALAEFLDTGASRIASTLGNPIYLAIYAFFHIFIALILLVRRDVTRGERLAYVAILPFLFTTLFLTATRGATLGLVIGLLLALTGIVFSLRHVKRVRVFAGITLIALLVMVGGLWAARDTALIQGQPTLHRLTNLSFSENTVYSRTVVWSIAWQGVKEKPLLGWGQENFNLVFNKYYDPRMYAQEPWFDRTHNIVFELLATSGFLGLLSYALVFITLLLTLYQTVHFTAIQKWLIFGMLAGYGFHNLTVFDNVVSYILFFSVIAWVYAQADDVWFLRRWEAPTLSRTVVAYVGMPILAILLTLVVWTANIVPLTVSRNLLDALRAAYAAPAYAENGDTTTAIASADVAFALFQKAVAVGSFGTQEVREQWGEAAGTLAVAAWMPTEKRNEWYAAAAQELEAQKAIAPEDARFPFLLGALHHKVGNYKAAQDEFLEALKLSPTKQGILVPLAVAASNAGDTNQAVKYAKQALELEESNGNARATYIHILLRAGMSQEAFEVVTEAPEQALEPNVLAAFVRTNATSYARQAWELGVTHKQEQGGEISTDEFFALVRVYAQLDRLEDATNEIYYLEQNYPQMSAMLQQALQEIEQLR